MSNHPENPNLLPQEPPSPERQDTNSLENKDRIILHEKGEFITSLPQRVDKIFKKLDKQKNLEVEGVGGVRKSFDSLSFQDDSLAFSLNGTEKPKNFIYLGRLPYEFASIVHDLKAYADPAHKKKSQHRLVDLAVMIDDSIKKDEDEQKIGDIERTPTEIFEELEDKLTAIEKSLNIDEDKN